ncbi:MAG: type II toxin-antitoxin system HigB family toxin [bacterium]|nr:type II toxin-antitoxin system HigB family toxin [bacterium]
MRVISRKALREFGERHADSEVPLRAWFKEAKEATWETPAEIKARYASASCLANDRVVFNIKGNDYRLVVAVRYDFGIVYIRFVGTHAEYDRIDAGTI